MRIACFDIGRCNFAYYIEEIDENNYEDLNEMFKKLPKKLQRKYGGEMNPKIDYIQLQLFKRGKRIKMQVVDLTKDEETNKYTNNVRYKLYTFLNSLKELWNTCDIFVIEEQYYNPHAKYKEARGVNKDAILMGESCYTYFIHNFHPHKEVCYFKASLKTQTLGCPSQIMNIDESGYRSYVKMKKCDRKKWSIEKAKKIFELRDDTEAIQQLSNKKQKQDDVSDCVIMCQARILKLLVFRDEEKCDVKLNDKSLKYLRSKMTELKIPNRSKITTKKEMCIAIDKYIKQHSQNNNGENC